MMFTVDTSGTVRDASGSVLITQESDGTWRDTSGKVLIFSIERFVKDICLGQHCFICGVAPEQAHFNKEHIIPQWILDFTNQRGGKIRLPNQTLFQNNYGGYSIPCCVQCNTELSDAFEKTLAPLFKAGYEALRAYLMANGSEVIFRWLALMYLKTHLRDARLALERNRRKGIDLMIGDIYEWKELHHVHCIARSHFTGINFDHRTIGSMLILPAADSSNAGESRFDYAAHFFGRTIMIRVGEIACYAVLNDASLVQAHFPRAWRLLEGVAPLDPWQIRELHCEFTWRNWCLKTRPEFSTVLVPKPHFETVMPSQPCEFMAAPQTPPNNEMTYGKLLHNAYTDFLEAMPPDESAEAGERILSGATCFEDGCPVWPPQNTPQEDEQRDQVHERRRDLMRRVRPLR